MLRHERARRFQDLLIEDVKFALREGKHLLAHAPTGIGKTDAVLSPAVPYSLKEGKTVLYLSPKISQHEMVLRVLQGMERKFGVSIKAVEVVGKQYMCIHPLASKMRGEDFYELCRKLKESEECPFYRRMLLSPPDIQLDGIRDHFFFIEEGRKQGYCPHELAFSLLPEANVIIGDYYHLFSPRVGKIFQKKLGKKLEDLVLIVDEAHNLPERIRKVLSSTLRNSFLERAAREASGIDPEIHRLLLDAKERLESFGRSLRDGEEREVDRDLIVEIFQAELGELGEELMEMGKEFLEMTGRTRSMLLRVGKFLSQWEEDDEGFLRYVKRRGELISVVKKNLDPAVLSSSIFEKLHASVLISGTLTPPEMYRDLLGIPFDRAVLREYPSPFPKENRLVLVYPAVTTRFRKRVHSEFLRIGKKISEIVERVPGNVAVFFPSYDVLKAVKHFIHTSKPVFEQRERMTPEELAELLGNFRAQRERGALLLAVAGGSLSEGVDYPGKDLLAAIVVGIPLAEMTLEVKKLIDYYEEKYGRGWLYGYIYPAITKVLQAMGRVIRSEKDRGVMVLMDERYTWKNYRKAFPRDLDFVVTVEPEKYVEEFFRKRGG